MTRVPPWSFVATLMFLAGCIGQVPTSEELSTSVPAMAEPNTTALTPANIAPTPASPMETSTPISTQEPPTAIPTSAARPAVTLTITVAPMPADIPEYRRTQYKHWVDEDGDCQDARQEVLILESVVEVGYESERKCRVARGRWYGAFTGTYVETPGDLDVDHR